MPEIWEKLGSVINIDPNSGYNATLIPQNERDYDWALVNIQSAFDYKPNMLRDKKSGQKYRCGDLKLPSKPACNYQLQDL